MAKIVLELSEEHARIVMDACEMLMRMRLGQESYPTELMLGWPLHDGMSTDEYCIRRDVGGELMRTYLGVVLGKNAWHMPNGRKDDLEAMAYEVWATMRHAMFKHEHPGVGETYDVRSSPPLSESGKEMPVCKVVD